MKCKDCKEKIWLLIINDLDLTEKTEVFNHIENCTECKVLFQRMQSDFSLWQKSVEPAKNDQFFERLKDRLTKQETVLYLNRPTSAILAVASIAIGIAMGFLFLLNSEVRESNNVFQDISNDYSLQFDKDQLFPVDFFID